MRRVLKFLVGKRIIVLALLGVSLYTAMSMFQISLWYILGGGVLLGVIFGKVFCRWVCPVGLVMEIIMSLSADTKFRQMYQYHKLGCPIAWISGLLNRISFYKIKLNTDSCSSCGICDRKCYLVAVEPSKFSLYKPSMENLAVNYSCSRCLECVAACPNGSLKYKI